MWERRTALLKAVIEGREAVVRVLVELGADINARDREGRTALLHAAIEGHEAVVRVLVELGADIDVTKATPPSNSTLHEFIIFLVN